MLHARELGIVLTDPAALAALGKTFESDWNVAVAVPNPPPTNCPK